MIRLDKMIAGCGLASRLQAKKMIRSGRVSVNGVQQRQDDVHVDEAKDQVCLDGTPIHYQKYVYFMMNKPKGAITATRDRHETVMDYLDEPYRDLFPVGRLDRDTEGLLLITNDGPLGHALLSPAHHVDKQYRVTLRQPLSETDLQALQAGIEIDGGERCLPAVYEKISSTECLLTIREGKYHQVKRMFLALNNEVTALKRIRMKHLCLDEQLQPGQYRPLSEQEIADLRESLD